MLGALILAKEERDKTADFLFVKPIRRHQVITRKLLAALINLVVFNLVTFVISAISVAKYNNGDSLTLSVFFVTSALFLLQLLFLGLGLLFGALARNAKAAASTVSFVILGSFILKVVIDLYDKIEPLQFLSPFMYFSAESLMFDHQIDAGYSVLALGLALVGAIGSYYFFQKRDLHS
jgi:ABC-2 type transport system permease protein